MSGSLDVAVRNQPRHHKLMQVVKCGRAAASRLSSSSHEELGMLLRSQVNFQNVSIHLDLEYELEDIHLEP